MNGEIYVQGGRSGEDLPEIRGRDGSYRLLTSAATGTVHFYYPRNYIAPDGRVFGFDVNGLMYYVTTEGNGSITPAGQLDSALVGRPSTAVMYRPGKILLVSGRTNRGGNDRHRRPDASGRADRFVVLEAHVGDGNRAG